MINVTISRLRTSSSGPQHPGSRYASLLARLWGKGDSRSTPPQQAQQEQGQGQYNRTLPNSIMNTNTAGTPNFSFDNNQSYQQPAAGTTATGTYDFNWLDLDAVGQFALDENYNMDVEAMWSSFGMQIPEDQAGGGGAFAGGLVGDEDAWNAPLDGSMFF